ncbi:MAG: hypothetical protein KC636_24840, partial [Myxococcales bacterium]|nr:hypothetical protein [Myxococcales bacterium]
MGWDHRARALLLLGLLTACGPGDDATTTDGSDATGESDATTSNPSSSTTTGGSDTGTSAGTDDSAGTDTGTAPVDLYDALAEIPGMDVEELEPPTPGVR